MFILFFSPFVCVVWLGSLWYAFNIIGMQPLILLTKCIIDVASTYRNDEISHGLNHFYETRRQVLQTKHLIIYDISKEANLVQKAINCVKQSNTIFRLDFYESFRFINIFSIITSLFHFNWQQHLHFLKWI